MYFNIVDLQVALVPGIQQSDIYTHTHTHTHTHIHTYMEKGMATHSSILAWRFHEQRSIVGYRPQGHKESDMTEQLTQTYIYKCIYPFP